MATCGASVSSELACGGAQNSIALAKWGASVTAVDLSSKQLAHARELVSSEGADVALIQADIERLTMFPDESFDTVLSSNGIEFVTDIGGCLQEWQRVLRPGGIAVISTVHPLGAFEWDEGQGALLVPKLLQSAGRGLARRGRNPTGSVD